MDRLLHTLFRLAIDAYVSRLGFRTVPVTIDRREVLVRAIMSPYHVNKAGTKLRRNAFLPPPHRDEVSVSRLRFVNATLCKFYARVRVERRRGRDKKSFVGLAFITSHRVKQCGANVVDSRAQYLGHGDIVHGFPAVAPGEPFPAAIRKALDDRCDALVRFARFRIDSGTSLFFWRSQTSEQRRGRGAKSH